MLSSVSLGGGPPNPEFRKVFRDPSAAAAPRFARGCLDAPRRSAVERPARRRGCGLTSQIGLREYRVRDERRRSTLAKRGHLKTQGQGFKVRTASVGEAKTRVQGDHKLGAKTASSVSVGGV